MIIADISIRCRQQYLIELHWYCLSSLLIPFFYVHLVPIGLCVCWLSLKIWLLWMSFPSVISYLSNILTNQRESGLSIRCFIFWTDLCYYCIKWKGAITAHELHKDPVSTKRRKHSWFHVCRNNILVLLLVYLICQRFIPNYKSRYDEINLSHKAAIESEHDLQEME